MNNRLDNPPRGWYSDPAQNARDRYWDGVRWTQVVRRAESIELKNRVLEPDGTTRVRPADPALDLPLAGWWRRFGSGVVDTIMAAALTAVLLVAGKPGRIQHWWQLWTAFYAEIQETVASGADFFTILSMPMASFVNLTALQSSTSSIMVSMGIVTAVYCAIFLGLHGATIGHRVMKVKVVKAPLPLGLQARMEEPFTEEKPGWLRAISKALSWSLFSCGGLFVLVQAANILMPLWHRRKQSVTDLFAATLLIKDQKDHQLP